MHRNGIFRQNACFNDFPLDPELHHHLLILINPESGARFLRNHQLASRAYPWQLIPVEWIDEYMYAQEVTSVVKDSAPFAEFIASLIEEEDKYYNYE